MAGSESDIWYRHPATPETQRRIAKRPAFVRCRFTSGCVRRMLQAGVARRMVAVKSAGNVPVMPR